MDSARERLRSRAWTAADSEPRDLGPAFGETSRDQHRDQREDDRESEPVRSRVRGRAQEYLDRRRRERESFYRSETLKRIAELQGAGVNAALELFREQEHALVKRARESQRLSGLITIGVGIGLMVFLKGVGDETPAYLVGLIPTLAGVALLVYGYVLGPKN